MTEAFMASELPIADATHDEYAEMVQRALRAVEFMYPGGNYYAASGDVDGVPVLVDLGGEILIARYDPIR